MDAADKIAVLDFGAQYTQLIAHRIRELSVYSEILPCTVPLEDLLAAGYKGVILSGGPSSVYEEDAPLPPKGLFKAGIPVLGICYGMQAMGYLLGGQVVPSERREYGRAEVRLTGTSPLLRRVEPESNGHVTVWMSHGDSVLKPPPGFIALATTANCPVAAMADEARRLYAVQFHPEVAHTPQGRKILENFLEVCEVKRSWSMASFIDTTIDSIRERIGQDRVLCALSGGVDSAVVAVLVHRAIGNQLTCMFVDNALRPARHDQQPRHQRGQGRQPRRLRRLPQTPEHDRMGIAMRPFDGRADVSMGTNDTMIVRARALPAQSIPGGGLGGGRRGPLRLRWGAEPTSE